MGDRRGTSLLSQKTLAETVPPAPPVVPPDPSPAVPLPPPAPEVTPRPVLYPKIAPSSVALHERQLRWLRERDRHAAATKDPPAKSET
ncbi:MAG: hypothetical protein WB789_01560 [Thermoplasmata archaeon]